MHELYCSWKLWNETIQRNTGQHRKKDHRKWGDSSQSHRYGSKVRARRRTMFISAAAAKLVGFEEEEEEEQDRRDRRARNQANQ